MNTLLGSWPLEALPGYFYKVYLTESHNRESDGVLSLALLVYDKNGEKAILKRLSFPTIALDDGIAIRLSIPDSAEKREHQLIS